MTSTEDEHQEPTESKSGGSARSRSESAAVFEAKKGSQAVSDEAAQGTERLGLERFLSDLLTGRTKRTNIKRKELDVLRDAESLDDQARERLLALAQQDVLLEGPLRLLLTGLECSVPRVTNTLSSVAIAALLSHPVFADDRFAGVLRNADDSASPKDAIELLLQRQRERIDWAVTSSAPSAAQFATCRRNAVGAVLLVFRLNRGMPLEDLHSLASVVWRRTTKRASDDDSRLRSWVLSKEADALAGSLSVVERQLEDQRRRSSEARRSLEVLQTTHQQLLEEFDDLEDRFQREKERADRAFAELEGARERWSSERLHLEDAERDLRGTVLRRLKREVSLLDEGLRALRREPPKVLVMDDHAGRVLDALRAEIGRLEAEGDG